MDVLVVVVREDVVVVGVAVVNDVVLVLVAEVCVCVVVEDFVELLELV